MNICIVFSFDFDELANYPEFVYCMGVANIAKTENCVIGYFVAVRFASNSDKINILRFQHLLIVSLLVNRGLLLGGHDLRSPRVPG